MTPAELKWLATPEFSAILAKDPELIRLNDELRSGERQIPALLDALLLPYECRVGSLPVKPLTAAKWAFLWGLNNGFVCGGASRKLTVADIDIFLYVLAQQDLRKLKLSLPEIPGEASGYSAAAGLPAESLLREIEQVIDQAFAPLQMMPPDPAGGDAVFDGVWLAQICGIAARESGFDYERVLGLPLSLVCSFYIAWSQREGADGDKIRRVPPEEIMAAIQARTDELGKRFLSDWSDPASRSYAVASGSDGSDREVKNADNFENRA